MKLFRIFGLPTRLVVFQRIARQPQTATQLAKEMSITRSAIVQHLTVLKSHGLVTVTSAGRNRIYSADRAALTPLAAWLARYGNEHRR